MVVPFLFLPLQSTNTTTMTDRDELLGMISDCYKDAYGQRPRLQRYSEYNEKELGYELNELFAVCKAQVEEDERRDAEEKAAYEHSITVAMSMGAEDRETAIRWIDESNHPHVKVHESMVY